MCEALDDMFRVRLYHPAITQRRVRREFDYWDVRHTGSLRRVAAFGPSRSTWLDYPNRVAFLGQVLLDLHRRPVDVIYTRDPSLLYLLRRLPDRFGLPDTPVFYEAHKLYHRVSARVDTAESEAEAVRLADRVIAISQGVREDLVRMGIDGERIDVLPLGVKSGRFGGLPGKAELRADLGLSPAKPIVVYSGSWEEWKGVETLMDAFARLAADDREATLMLAGVPGTVADALRSRFAGTTPGRERLIVHDHLSRRELARWLRTADIGVVPNSDTVLGARYTSPLKVFEYLAAGLALAVSDLPSLRYLLSEKEAVFARPDDPLDLAGKISGLLRSDERRLMMQRAAIEKAAGFDYGIRAGHILRIYQEYCQRSPADPNGPRRTRRELQHVENP